MAFSLNKKLLEYCLILTEREAIRRQVFTLEIDSVM